MTDPEPRPCGSCGKPSIAAISRVPVCLNCYVKFQHAEAARETSQAVLEQNNMAMMNHAIAEMGRISGIHGDPQVRIPPMPQPPATFNFSFNNSSIGVINNGYLNDISVNLNNLHAAGADRARDALKTLTQAVIDEATLDETDKNDLLGKIAFLSNQATLAPKERNATVVAPILDIVESTAKTIGSVASAWQTVEPVLRSFFS